VKDHMKRATHKDGKANKGPGGWKCSCCQPANGKVGARRAARRALKVDDRDLLPASDYYLKLDLRSWLKAAKK